MTSPGTLPSTQHLVVETQQVDDVRSLIALVDPQRPLLWLRKGRGLAGVGEALRLEFSGPTRMQDAAAAWREIAAAATVSDPLRMAGTGLVAFGTFAFADHSAQSSVLIVPQLLIGRRDGVTWVTRIRADDTHEADVPANPRSTAFGPEYRIPLTAGAESADGFLEHVTQAVERILDGELSKVVLSRDLTGRIPADADLRRVVSDLALGYPDCWTFAVDGLVGSSPETLVGVQDGSVTARVLAGTASRGADAEADQRAAVNLVTSAKDQDEHQFAVQSVLASLRPHTSHVLTSEMPFTLKLPNLWHLATDIEGTLTDDATSLDLIDALHPTAAVAGSPTPAAVALIDQLEPFDRGRYAGPIGWVGADGGGEWAIALRCAQVEPGGDVTAYAGCGIVGESVPEKELTETRMKFRPIVDAFG
ncbi:isochorismate synthase [Mycetocola miduiensis]|uniref:isochorismate synthase n=1 Tax=Mycetocola miduiensis TaxID=995034 RepID=A0A1I4YL74_9MICO|nr:isochorismate synthase [Mycetocola miduiensis]SFN38737.1 isochorismate synthase [Mycetocola miduiensis]